MGERSEDPTPLPGGWVNGIGWVALLHSVPDGCLIDMVPFPRRDHYFDPSPLDGELVRSNYDDRPVIVTRWADGETPTPPAALPVRERPAETDTWQMRAEEAEEVAGDLRHERDRLRAALVEMAETCREGGDIDASLDHALDALACSPPADPGTVAP